MHVHTHAHTQTDHHIDTHYRLLRESPLCSLPSLSPAAEGSWWITKDAAHPGGRFAAHVGCMHFTVQGCRTSLGTGTPCMYAMHGMECKPIYSPSEKTETRGHADDKSASGKNWMGEGTGPRTCGEVKERRLLAGWTGKQPRDRGNPPFFKLSCVCIGNSNDQVRPCLR